MDKMLVIEDDESICRELIMPPRANGYETADSPPCNLPRPDISLPGENGGEVCRKLRLPI